MSVFGHAILTDDGHAALAYATAHGTKIKPAYFMVSNDATLYIYPEDDPDPNKAGKLNPTKTASDWVGADIWFGLSGDKPFSSYKVLGAGNEVMLVSEVPADQASDECEVVGLFLEDGTLFAMAKPMYALPPDVRQYVKTHIIYTGLEAVVDFTLIPIELFIDLADCPSTYVGAAGMAPVVNDLETGLVFCEVWTYSMKYHTPYVDDDPDETGYWSKMATIELNAQGEWFVGEMLVLSGSSTLADAKVQKGRFSLQVVQDAVMGQNPKVNAVMGDSSDLPSSDIAILITEVTGAKSVVEVWVRGGYTGARYAYIMVYDYDKAIITDGSPLTMHQEQAWASSPTSGTAVAFTRDSELVDLIYENNGFLANFMADSPRKMEFHYFVTGHSGSMAKTGAGELAKVVIAISRSLTKMAEFTYDVSNNLTNVRFTYGLLKVDFAFTYDGTTKNVTDVDVTKVVL